MPSTTGHADIGGRSLPLQVLHLCFDAIASHVPLPTIISLSRTHTFLIDKLANHLRQSFEGLLRSRISAHRIDAFRSLLLETRAVISGSTALHFILRDSHWRPGDFDLYTPFGTGYALVRWLEVNEGYRIVFDGSRNFAFHPDTVPVPAGPCDWLTDLGLDFLPASSKHSPSSKAHYGSHESDIYRVYKLASRANTFIDVVESTKPSFLPPITKFHSTLVMNYLTPKSVVILYPALTFKRQGILQYRNNSPSKSYDDDHPPPNPALESQSRMKQDYVEKYERRGFTLYSHPADLRRPCGAACPTRFREVGNQVDSWSVEVPFNMTQKSSEQFGIGRLSIANTPSLSLDSRTGQDDFRGSIPLSNISISRPSLPPTTWALNILPSPGTKQRQGKPVCINQYCPLQGRRQGHLVTQRRTFPTSSYIYVP